MKADRAGKKPAKQKDQPEDDAEAARRANRLVSLYGAIFEHLVAQPTEEVKTHAA